MSQGKKVRKVQPHYAIEVKQAAVDRVLAGASLSEVASAVGCGRGRIHYWLQQWEKRGGQWPEGGRRSRPPSLAPPGGADREAALERLVGQQQAELDFLREALRLMEQVRRPTEPGASSPTSSSRAGRLPRKAV